MTHKLCSKITLLSMVAGAALCPALAPAQFVQTNIGALSPAGVVTPVEGGFNVSAGGSDIGGNNDQFAFNYQVVTGDFDFKLRVGSLTQADTWTKAGLMARATLDTNSPFAAAFATPSAAGAYFTTRATVGAVANSVGSFPVNYPNTWLRLQRTNNLFASFASVDGNSWVRLGSLTVTMPGPIFVGMAVTSRTNGLAASAELRDFGTVTSGEVVPYSPHVEPPGPSSRLTPFAITEIMYNPAPDANSNVLEFVEIYNSNPFVEEIGGYRLSGNIDYTFPADMMLQGGAYVVIARDPAAVQTAYGISGVLGPYLTTNSLPGSGTLRLRNKEDAVLLEVPYSSQPPWPAGADGAGHSLVLARPSYGERDSYAWGISDKVGGSPGKFDAQSSTPQRAVVINEFFANSELPDVDFIELYNHSNLAVDISGCTLSDDPHTNKFVVPPGTSIPARGFVMFDQGELSFGLSSGGETIYFRSADGTRVLDSIRFEAQANGVSAGRYPNGSDEFHPLRTRTPGAANDGIRVHDIVINEIMYRPVTGNDDDEYVELYNKGTNDVSLAGWRFVSGISYTFPSNAVLAPDSYLVVAANVSRMVTNYPNLNPDNTYGDFKGSLRNRGDRVALAMPDTDISTNGAGVVRTNTVYVVVDEVTYLSGGNWPKWANEGGSSLELVDARSNHRLAQNWADSDETQKAPWTSVTATGNMDNPGVRNFGATMDLPEWAEILPLNEGEYLVDNYEVIHSSGNSNFLTQANSTFESGLGSWFLRGTVGRSFLENSGGFGNGKCLHIVASARGDTMYNRALCKPIPSVPTNGVVTLRAQVRWLRGWPEMLLRLKGNWFETYGRLNIPSNLGTPGLRNSAAATNAAPAIYAVKHAPVVPAANEPVVVTARVQDSDGLASVVLKYRIDPSKNYVTANMMDNGTGGDAVAGDGLFSSTIPGQATGVMVAFQVAATDSLGAARVFPNQLPYWPQPFECLVRFDDPVISSGFASYRQWMSISNVAAFTARPALDNERMFETVVYGNFRAIYNASMKWAGSPYHQFSGSPVTTAAHYAIDIPPDDLFLGTDGLNKIHAPGNSPFDDNTAQREQICYWTARQLGLPWNYRRFVNMYFNGNRRNGTTSLMEDTMTPGDDLVDAYFPDDNDGDLYKFQPWFEQGDPTSGANNRLWHSLNKFSTISNGVPVHKTAGYRQNFLVRAANGTANGFQPVFDLIDAAQATNNLAVLAANLNSIADMEEWFRTFAVPHAVGDWDHFGYRNSQNMYGYKPTKDKWKLMIWDMNIVLDNSGSDGASSLTLAGNLTSVNGQDKVMPFLYRIPEFRRMYLRALKELCTSVWVTNKYATVLDAKYNAMLASGITPTSPNTQIKPFIATARSTILNSIQAEDATNFLLTSSSAIDTTNSYAIVTGQAPVEAKTILVNGVEYSITWTSAKNFSILVPVVPGNTVLNLQAFDLKSNALTGFTTNVTVNSTAEVPPAESVLVINEIMSNPLTPDAEFVEIYNQSGFTYDLSGWRFNGLDYIFPEGSVITNRQYIVLVKNRAAFITAYGSSIPVFGQFAGNLQSGGETITLIKPGATAAEDVVIDKVRYEGVLPWPVGTNGVATASSIQLVDVTQDNSRPLNWSTRYIPAVYGAATNFAGATNGGWRRGVYKGTFQGPPSTPGTNFLIFLGAAGDVYLDDLMLVIGTEPEAGTNWLANGDFESEFSPAWSAAGTHSNTVVSTTFSHSGNGSLHVIATGPGAGFTSTLRQFIPPAVTNNTPFTLSYWFYSTDNSTALTLRTTPGSAFLATTNAQVQVIPPFSLPPPLITPAVLKPTPGSNNIDTASLLTIPPLWLNELQAQNTTGIADAAGDRDPWLELYNAGTNTLSLDTYYLADNYDTNLVQWPFPAGATIGPGQFKIIWADGEPGESTGGELHTSFRLAAGSGTVALVRVVEGQPQVLDYLTYNAGPGLTYGDYPDGQPFNRVTMRDATPGSTNIARPFNLYINEWLAGNTNTIADAADGQYEDWFEIYNPGTNAVDLGGLWLGDSSNSRFQVPTNGQYQVPAGGHLLVWADNEPNQNSTTRDLHVNFQLGKAADSITLYAADRSTIIDSVSFTNQIDDISHGRYPDGSLDIFVLAPVTPREANLIPGANSAPVLAPIGTQTATLGQPLSFTMSATDAQAGQTLTFSILSGAPAGAALTTGGLFTWNTAFSLVPSTNHVTVQVADNGTPMMSDTETFTLIGLPPPPTIGVSGNQITIGFQTIPGKTYRVEYQDNLNEAGWQRLNNQDYVAAGASLVVQDDIGANPQRFYRIVQLD